MPRTIIECSQFFSYNDHHRVSVRTLEHARKFVCPSDYIDNDFFLHLLVLIGLPNKFELEGAIQNKSDKTWILKYFRHLKANIILHTESLLAHDHPRSLE